MFRDLHFTACNSLQTSAVICTSAVGFVPSVSPEIVPAIVSDDRHP
jgi:hypothetical protein